MLRPTYQARAGYDIGSGPGISEPYGNTGRRFHNGQDYFWLTAASAARLGITSAASRRVLACVNGPAHAVYDPALGYGYYQQLNATTRLYYWHLSSQDYPSGAHATTDTELGNMGHTGSAAGTQDHLHFEVRVAPYGFSNRVDPAPYFTDVAGDIGTPFPTPITRRRSYPGRRKTMLAYVLNDGRGALGPTNKTRTYLIGAGYFEDTTDQPTANAVSVLVNGYGFNDDGSPFVNRSPNLTYKELHAKAVASGACPPELLAQIKAAAA